MRDYSTLENLYKAAGLAALVTAMSVGRLVQAGVSLSMFIPLTFLSMIFVSGAVTAWGRHAGMAGMATDRSTLTRGLLVVGLLLIVALPVYVLWLDPRLRDVLVAAERPGLVEMSYPSTLHGKLAMMLWSAGFQAMFLVAAPMSFFARLTRRVWVAVAFCVVTRGFFAYLQLAENGIVDGAPLFVASALAGTFVACVVFCRFGLIPLMVFAAGLDLRAFF